MNKKISFLMGNKENLHIFSSDFQSSSHGTTRTGKINTRKQVIS